MRELYVSGMSATETQQVLQSCFFLSSTSLLHCVGSAVAIVPDRTGHNPWNRSAV